MSVNVDAIQLGYQAYYGRPADPGGLAYWLNAGAAAADQRTFVQNLSQTETWFAIRNQGSTVALDTIYKNLFGRSIDLAGLQYWVAEIAAGRTNLDRVGADIAFTALQQPASSADRTVMTNRLEAMKAFTAAIDTSAEITAYSNAAAFNSAATFIASIGATPATAAQITTAVGTATSAGENSGGQTFTLTTGADNLTGTARNDVFNALIGTNASLTAADVINGGAGTDTLNITYANAGGNVTDATQGAVVSGVELINVRNTNATGDNVVTVNATGLGLTGVSANGSGDVTATNLASGATFTANGTSAGVFNVGYVAATTNASLALNGATTGNITVTGTGITTAAIASTGSANTAGTINVAGATTINVSAATNLTATAIATSGTNSTLNVSGAAASVNVGTLDTDLRTINASGLTAGGLTATLSNAAQVVTGGTGADIITTNSLGLLTGSVDAGAGTDRLVVSANGDLDTAAKGARYTNFEVLQVQTGVSANLDNISGITAIRINDAAGATGVTNLTATQAAAITVIAADGADGAITIGVKGAATPGQTDTVALTIDDGATAVGNLALGTPTIANVEKLSINAVDNVTVTALTGAGAVDMVTLTGAATQNITTGAVAASNFAINGSAATGALTLNATNASVAVALTGGSAADNLTGSANGDALTGGAGNDTIGGLAGADTISGGDGADFITGGAGTDNLTGGAGNDTFRYTGGDAVVADVANVDRITDFVAGSDKFSFATGANNFLNGLNLSGTTTVSFATAQTIATAADLAAVFGAITAISASGDATVQAKVVTVSAGAAAGTYLYVNDNTDTVAAAEDLLINITGITGTLAAGDFVFA